MGRIRRSLMNAKNEKGFTLIEMAIVLIIIGVIIGAVVKGKDLIKSAEQKKIYTKYVNAWNLAYLSFYDRTGHILGDWSTASPAGVGRDGFADTDDGPDDVLEPAFLIDATASTNDDLFYDLTEIGLEIPRTNTANPWQYKYTDINGVGHVMSISFRFDDVSHYNYMEILNVPAELGIALDTMIDGEADGRDGDFLSVIGDPATVAEWNLTADNIARFRLNF